MCKSEGTSQCRWMPRHSDSYSEWLCLHTNHYCLQRKPCVDYENSSSSRHRLLKGFLSRCWCVHDSKIEELVRGSTGDMEIGGSIAASSAIGYSRKDQGSNDAIWRR
jgi:hypothetical protein